MKKGNINLVFHKLVNNYNEINNRYDFVFDHAIAVIREVMEKSTQYSGLKVVVFLDDGHVSQWVFSRKIIELFGINVYISLIAEKIGQEGYLSESNINDLKHCGVDFCAHGFSHAALGKYHNDKVLETKIGGIYRNLPCGHKNIMMRNEVKFQVCESAANLEKFDLHINSFVYPYGIYNNEIIEVVRESGLYKYAYTCDDDIESGLSQSFALPRFMVYNDVSILDRIFRNY